MEQKSEEPRRITSTEARAKLLQSLIREIKAPVKESERSKVDETRVAFIRDLANEP